MHVIGTAGHVDHGKSTLVAALTGTHPDRLKEEREREMTIDLGFAWFTLPGGEPVGIVDVPGHRDFIENMLAGIGGIEAALFVIAADEGVMPQTREHLAILDILQIQAGVIALTKIDLVEDAEWLDMIEADIRQTTKNTALADAPVVRVSAKSGAGIPDLIGKLEVCLSRQPHRPDFGRPRLPVDRVFTMQGFGTIVTGTLTDGSFQIGDEVEILPQKLRARIRGLQTHRQKENVAAPGSRTAINLSGIELHQVQRGNVIAHPGDYETTRLVDVRFRCLADASAPIKHNSEVKLFTGASDAVARLRLLGYELLSPGEEGWLQLELDQPLVMLRGDRYILRRPSPGETLGGGMVVDPRPARRHKRFSDDVLTRLEALVGGVPEDVLLQTSLSLGIAPIRDVVIRSGLEQDAASMALQSLLASGALMALESGQVTLQSDLLVTASSVWRKFSEQAVQAVTDYHSANPLKKGIPREELKNRLALAARPFNALLKQCQASGLLADEGAFICRPGHEIRFTYHQKGQIENLLKRFQEAPFAPPSIKECQEAVGEDVYAALIELDKLVPVSGEVVFRREDYERLLREVKNYLELKGSLTVAEFRDMYDSSRRYGLAFLEHLDSIGVTVRVGDYRKLRR
jgi:selenocysteine-specific elongation factor